MTIGREIVNADSFSYIFRYVELLTSFTFRVCLRAKTTQPSTPARKKILIKYDFVRLVLVFRLLFIIAMLKK